MMLPTRPAAHGGEPALAQDMVVLVRLVRLRALCREIVHEVHGTSKIDGRSGAVLPLAVIGILEVGVQVGHSGEVQRPRRVTWIPIGIGSLQNAWSNCCTMQMDR